MREGSTFKKTKYLESVVCTVVEKDNCHCILPLCVEKKY